MIEYMWSIQSWAVYGVSFIYKDCEKEIKWIRTSSLTIKWFDIHISFMLHLSVCVHDFNDLKMNNILITFHNGVKSGAKAFYGCSLPLCMRTYACMYLSASSGTTDMDMM